MALDPQSLIFQGCLQFLSHRNRTLLNTQALFKSIFINAWQCGQTEPHGPGGPANAVGPSGSPWQCPAYNWPRAGRGTAAGCDPDHIIESNCPSPPALAALATSQAPAVTERSRVTPSRMPVIR